MLLVIKSARPQDQSPARLSYSSERRVVETRFVLVDGRYSRPLDTQYNRDTFLTVSNFLTQG